MLTQVAEVFISLVPQKCWSTYTFFLEYSQTTTDYLTFSDRQMKEDNERMQLQKLVEQQLTGMWHQEFGYLLQKHRVDPALCDI